MKQMLVVRKDLKMRKGKIAAQCAHASMKMLLDRRTPGFAGSPTQPLPTKEVGLPLDETQEGWEPHLILNVKDIDPDWLFGSFTKVCVSVNSEEELLECVEKARSAGIPVALITDNGTTEFGGVKTNTVAAIGPASNEALEPITGGLKLL